MAVADGQVEDRPTFHIGDVAERVGLSLRTIRHWDQVGLVTPSARTTGGFRLYTSDDIERLAFVKLLKPLDFRIEEIRELLDTRDRLAAAAPEALAEVADHLEVYVTLVEQRCAMLKEQMRSVEVVAASLRVDLEQARDRALTGSPGVEPGTPSWPLG